MLLYPFTKLIGRKRTGLSIGELHYIMLLASGCRGIGSGDPSLILEESHPFRIETLEQLMSAVNITGSPSDGVIIPKE